MTACGSGMDDAPTPWLHVVLRGIEGFFRPAKRSWGGQASTQAPLARTVGRSGQVADKPLRRQQHLQLDAHCLAVALRASA
jgi:hypothetical protein